MKLKTPRTPALGAFFIIILYLGSGLPMSEVSGAPALLEVFMDSNSAAVNTTYNDTSVPVSFNGTIKTNFPVVTVDIHIQGSCGNFVADATPQHVQMRGIDILNFTIIVAVIKGMSINTTCFGPVTVLASTVYTSNVYQASQTITVHVQWGPAPMNETASLTRFDDINAPSDDPTGGLDTGLVSFSIFFFMPLAIMLGHLRRKKTRSRHKV